MAMTRRPPATAPAKVNWAAPKLKGLAFAFTGRSKYKQEAAAWIKREGGTLLPKLTNQTTHLVVGEVRSRPTADEQKAVRLNVQGASIQVIEEADFWKLVAPTREELIAMLK